MKILIAEDNPFHRRILSAALTEWGYTVILAADGEEAWNALQENSGPKLAIIDWIMPRLDGLALCRRIRAALLVPPPYLILLTAQEGKKNIVTALEAGADDFINKPFDRMELHARVRVGLRMVHLQSQLTAKVDDLENALSQAQKMEAVGRLAGGVAHDFNNLLMVISGSSDLLEDGGELNARQHEFVRMIKTSAQRGAALTRQLLAFSRKQILQPEILNLNDVVVKADKLLRRLIGEDIDLATRLASDVGSIKADPTQMEQVMINLVLNARDAMPDGGSILLETKMTEIAMGEAPPSVEVPPGPYVLLSVSDTGHGMSADTKSHLFEPFFTTKPLGKGTGLGLPTAYGIVRQSGGFIRVDSEPGAGATFRVYLPRVEPVAGLPPAALGDDSEVAVGQMETILLVEDDDQVRKMVRVALENRLYHVLEAGDGKEALELHERWTEPIDLLLTDVVMPHVNGNQLADRLQRDRPGLKVLFMSGYTDDRVVHERIVNSGQPFLQKPFSSLSLQTKLRELLNA